jgi:hypothetical protein
VVSDVGSSRRIISDDLGPRSQPTPLQGLRVEQPRLGPVLGSSQTSTTPRPMSPFGGTKPTSESVYECLLSGVKRTKQALAITRFSRLNSEVRYVMEKVPGRDMWAVIDTVTHRPALVNDVPQIDLGLDDADDLTDLLNRLDREASVSAKH